MADIRDDYWRGYSDGEATSQFFGERDMPDPEFEGQDNTAAYKKGWWDGFNKLWPRHVKRKPDPEWITELLALLKLGEEPGAQKLR
jgi:hypothetical protein